MPILLTFQPVGAGSQTQIGTEVLGQMCDDAPASPATVLTGLWRDASVIQNDQRNMVRRMVVRVDFIYATPLLLTQAIAAAQGMLGKVGTMRIKEDSTNRIVSDATWTFESLTGAQPGEGFAGRLATNIVATFIGSSELTYSLA